MKKFFYEILVAFCLPVCIAFKRDCPGPSERKFRAISFCNKSSAFTYSCLYDENRGVNVESCKATVDFAPPGNKYVQRGQPDFTPCAKYRYQPFRLWSNVSGQCIFKKSQCVSDGQFLYNNGSTEADRSCRCDYTHGYAFIKKPRHPCYCIPSEEECSCYKKYCPNKTLLTPDYNCAKGDDMQGKESYRCPIIVNDRLPTGSFSINQYNSFWKQLWNEFSPKFLAFFVTAICTLLVGVEGLLVFFCYKGQERKPLAPNDVRLHTDADTYGITVTWSHPSHISADKRWHFKIKWRVNNSVDECSPKVAGTVNKYKIPDVFPCAEYKITVTACISEFDDTEHGGYYRESEPSEESTITTEDPQQPQDLKAIEELNGIIVSWEPPRFPSFTKINNYKIQQICGGHKDTICVPAENSSYLVSDVFPSQTYSFAINSTCRTLDNTCDSELSHPIKCTAKDPKPPRNLKGEAEPFPPKDLKAVADIEGIYLSWSVPEYPTIDKIRHFIVEINDGNKEIINVSSNKSSFLISDVFPSTSYSIRMAIGVITGNNIQTDEIQSSEIKTESEYTELIYSKTPDPLPPMDVIASPKTNGIMVSWTRPDYPPQDKIQCYKLVMTNLDDETQTRDIKPNNKGDGSILMSNVSSNTEYSFTIATAAKGTTSLRDKCQLPCDAESVPSKIVKCVTKVICETTKVKEEKKNFLRLEKLFHMANSAVIKKIEEKILETNLETLHLDTAADFLKSLSKEHKESIYGTRDNYGATESMDYELILLLRFWLCSNQQEVPTIQFDKKPSKVDTSIQADLSRIYLTRKRYQNSSMKTISIKQFDEDWKYLCMAVVRLGGNKYEEKCTRVLRQLSSQVSRQMSNVKDEKIGNQDIVEAILQEQENTSSKPHECSCQDLHHLEIRSWKKDTDPLDIKGVIDGLQQELEDLSCVTLVGKENEGVNAILHHIALSFVEHNECYVIIPCKSPVEIVNHYKLDRHQLFVLEDACGRLFPLHESVQFLIEHDSSFKQMLQAGKTKIMISFTACVYWKTIFSKTDVFFRKRVKELSSENSYPFATQPFVSTVKFETAWSDQLDDWFLNDKPKHCALFAIIIHNGLISSSWFEQHEIRKETDRIQQILKTYALDCVQVGDSLWYPPENYVLKDGDQYKVLNSIMFHFLCCYFCEHNDLQNLFLQLVDAKVFYGKLVLQCTQENFGEDCISVNNLQEERYFRRILDDVSRKDYSVFYSRQMQVPAFRQKLTTQFTKIGGEWIIFMINTKELQEIAITGRFQGSPLAIACSQGYEEIVSFMLSYVEKSIKDQIVSALFRIAVGQGYPLSVVRLMIRSNANVNIVWDDSWTALGAACQRGNHEIANFLINEGSNINRVDALGTTPLMLACYTGLYETVQLLIEKGVNINTLNKSKMSALKYACISGHENVVSLLLENEAYTSTVYDDGRTPLVIAFDGRHDRIISLLKNKGFEVDMKDTSGKTALAMACINGEKGTVQSLIKLGANLNSRDNEGWVPLSRACKRGAEHIVEVLLIEDTLDLNTADNDGWTSLKKASVNGHNKVVEILLNTHKLEIDQADNDGWTPLMSSCQMGYVKVAELLLCGNADVNYRSNDGITPLMTAVDNEHIAVINLLLENNANVDLDDNDGWTPLRFACNNNKYKAVVLLLEKRPDVDKPDKKGYTPLRIACKNGYYKISSLLIDAGSDVNRKDKDEWTPLRTASKEGHLKICKLLISHNADINIPDLKGWTPLHTAAANGNTEIVECLLKNGVTFDSQDKDGWTELMSACKFGHEKTAKLLVENGSSVNHQSVKKLTPLIAACQNNSTEVMDILIKNGANVNVFNVDGWTPLHFTCMRGHIKASEVLIQHGADVNKADNKGWTPLKFACRNKRASLAQILINAKADVDVVDNDGWTPLKTACRVGDEDTVDVLLNNNADINKKDKEGWTPLKSAIINEHYQIVKKLLIKNADINKVDLEGWTSLMSACKVGNFKVINVLLEHVKHEAVVNYYSERTGDTPLIIACTYSDDGEIIKLLLEKGADSKKPNNIGQTALLLACMYGKTQNVSKLLDHGVETDVTDQNGVSPLKAACQGLYLEIVELLIKTGANVNIVDQNGYTPLISACERQNIQLVELLIRSKADVDKSTQDGWNPYLIAIKNHDDEIANLLIKKGADKSKASLLKACEIGHLPIIQFLLDQDRSIESKDEGVMTPLKMVIEKRKLVVLDLFIKKGRTFELENSMLKDLIHEFDNEGLSALAKACRDANTETMIYLLKHGADLYQPDKMGMSPLIYACLNGNEQNLDLLLEKVAEVNSRGYLDKADSNGYTPLTAAASQGHVPLIELLVTNGTDVNIFDERSKSPIMYACERGDLRTVKTLISKGASMTINPDRTCSPFILAKQANAFDIIDYFIEKKIELKDEDILSISNTESVTVACKNGFKALLELIIGKQQAGLNSPDSKGYTSLMHACMMNQKKIVEVIVKQKIDIDSETSDGKTALMFACVEGYTDIAENLLKHKANINKCDNTGINSLMIACKKGSLSCIKLLMKYGADMDIKSSAELSAFMIACHTGNYEIVDHLVSQESYKPLKYDVRKLLDRTHCKGKELIQSVCKGGYESLFNILIESEAEIEAADGDGNSLIMLASRGGHDGIIENLLTREANLNHKNKNGHTPLRMACNGGLARSVKILLKNDAHPNETDAGGRTPLMIVSQGGCLDVVEILIQHHADINLGDRKGTTALMLATKSGQYNTAECLINNGADTSKCDNEGLNSLMAACQNGHIAIVRLIVETKKDLNSSDNDGFTPLRFACDGGHNEIVNFLIKNKAEVDKADTRCWTPLKSSCARGGISTVTLLLEKGAVVNKQDADGWTPLMSACRYGHDNIAELLLNWKAGINMTEVDGWTALRIACNNGQESTVKFLVSKGANVNQVDKQGWSPLKGACVFDSITSKKYEEIVTCLIQNDADVNLVDTDGWTCLMSACQSDHIDIVNLLLSNIIDINKANSNGSTAFTIACSMGHTKVAELLLKHDAEINKADSDGWTPLKLACRFGHKDTVKMLLHNRANVNIEDEDGWTPLMSACVHGNREIVKYLLENKADVEYIAHDGFTTPMNISKKCGHRRIEKMLKKSFECSVEGDDEDDEREHDEDYDKSGKRFRRTKLTFQQPISNDSDEDEDDEDGDDDSINLPSGLLESLIENDDWVNYFKM